MFLRVLYGEDTRRQVGDIKSALEEGAPVLGGVPVDVFVRGGAAEGEIVGGDAYDVTVFLVEGNHGTGLSAGEPVVDVPELFAGEG